MQPGWKVIVEQRVVCPTLIGREAPLTAALHVLTRARNGLGGTLLVSGEAGIGKSRFLSELSGAARGQGFLVLQGSCFEADRARPYAPLLDLVRGLAATSSPALAAHAFAPAAVELVTLFPELRAVFADVSPRQALEPEDERHRLFHAFTEATRTLAQVQPVLLILEDVHWSDEASLGLILHLARRITTESVTLALSFRSDEIDPSLAKLLADLDRARCAAELDLRPLGLSDVGVMLQDIFGSRDGFETTFVHALHGLTEGNPFFVEEVLKSLLAAGELARTESGWRGPQLDTVQIPRTAAEAVARRLADLSDEAGELASIAAVAGRRFDFGLLRAVTARGEAELLPLLKELIAAQLVVEETADRFAFRHALTRESIRTRLLARERMALHRRIGDALLSRTEPPGADDAIADHMYEAEAWDPAREYALRAASRATAVGAPREALRHLDRAVSATERSGRPVDAVLRVRRGRAHETLGHFQAAHDDFSAGLAAALADGDRPAEWEALHSLGLLWAARDYEQAGRYRHDALELARALGDPVRLAHSLNRIGNWFVNRDEPHAGIPHHREAVTIFERQRHQRGICETVDLLAMAHHIAGAQAEAVGLYERCIALFTELEDRRGLANALSVMLASGPSHHASAGPVSASAQLPEILDRQRAVQLASEIGWRAGEAFSGFLVADALAWRGELARAMQLALQSLAIALELGHREWQCGAARALGFIALDLGDVAEAIGRLEQAHGIARRLNSALWMRWTAAPYAVALARGGRLAEATAVLDWIDAAVPAPDATRRSPSDESLTLGQRHLALARLEIALAGGSPVAVLDALGHDDGADAPRLALLRVEALVALERWEEAGASLTVARRAATAQGARPILMRIDAIQGTLHLRQRRRREARRAFDAARALAAQLVAGLEDEAAVATFQASVDRIAPPPPAPTARQAAKAAHGGLTRRERQTAALIARGLPNRAIAHALGIGERTVEGYVASSLAKLAFTSRAQIAVWATEHGLAGETGLQEPTRP